MFAPCGASLGNHGLCPWGSISMPGFLLLLDFGEVRFCELNKSGNIEVELFELKNSKYLGD
jgi:hypothetical protein